VPVKLNFWPKLDEFRGKKKIWARRPKVKTEHSPRRWWTRWNRMRIPLFLILGCQDSRVWMIMTHRTV